MSKTRKNVERAPAARLAPRRAAAPAPAVPAAVPPATPSRKAPPTREALHRMIAEAAYYIALRKGFDSDPRANWLEAEAEIEARLKAEGRA